MPRGWECCKFEALEDLDVFGVKVYFVSNVLLKLKGMEYILFDVHCVSLICGIKRKF